MTGEGNAGPQKRRLTRPARGVDGVALTGFDGLPADAYRVIGFGEIVLDGDARDDDRGFPFRGNEGINGTVGDFGVAPAFERIF